MKTIYTSLLSLLAVFFISSCADKYSEEQLMNIPVYMDYNTLRSSVSHTAAQDLVHPGKIYFKENYLFIVENLEGVHVIDVSNPADPQNKLFIKVPGCKDIAIKNSSLYADSYVDLVTIDLSDLNNPKETERLKDVFQYTVPVAENEKIPYEQVEKEKGIVIEWEVKRQKTDLEKRREYYPYPMYDKSEYLYNSESGRGLASGGSGVSFGKSGSMARFGLYDQYLYVVNNYMLYLFDVQNAAKPAKAGSQGVSWNVETLFIYDNHLFFGTTTGMMAFDLEVPAMPKYISNFWHVTSCDPVVIQDDYAYITLRSGTDCGGNEVNRLDVVKLSNNYKQYDLISTYTMEEPYGLGIDNNVLFICDGKAGLKVYDITDKRKIVNNLLASFPSIKAYDVIPVEGYLFMVGDDGFYLYDYSNLNDIKQIGHIPIVKK